VDELDRILSSDEMLEPSSGFATAALRAVHEAAAEPPPLPFPWGRLAIGLAACGTLTVSATALALRTNLSLASLPTLASLPPPLPQLAVVAPELGYATITILASLGTLRAVQRFARRTLMD
jgi:hypothetical protein